MRRSLVRPAGLAALVVAAAVVSPSGPAEATVDRVRHGSATFASQVHVHLFGDSGGSHANRITVEGDWVDTSNRWESTLSGVTVRKTSGSRRRLDLEVTVGSGVADGAEGEIRIRYPIELSGYDRVLFRVHKRPRLVTILPGPPAGAPDCFVGRSCFVRLYGERLDTLVVSIVEVMLQVAGGRKYRKLKVVSATRTEAIVEFEAVSEGEVRIDASLFADRRVDKALHDGSVASSAPPRTMTIRKLDFKDRTPVR